MQLPLYWIDAFGRTPFTGNPAAVVPLSEWLPDGMMQKIAFENGLAETAFFLRLAPGRYHLRWFTPCAEVDLCGHATLATAFTLFTKLGYTEDQVIFDTRSGQLSVRRMPDGRIELDFPSRPAVPADPPTAVIKGLGATPMYYAEAEANLAVFDSEADILALKPDFAALATLEQYGTIATAPGDECDFVSRFFAPRVGVPEDSVTGSAHCVLTPYWSDRLGKTKHYAKQLSSRGGELWCELFQERVRITGHARLYLSGKINI